MKDKKEKYIAYTCVYTVRQAKDGYSLENQKKEIENYCKMKGHELIHVFSDEGISGKNIQDREEFINMMRYVENENVDGIIIWKISRISRNFSDFLAITKKIENKGKKLISLKDNYDSSSDIAKVMRIMNNMII